MPSQHSFRSTWSPAPLGRRLGLDPPRASRKGSHRFWVSSGLELVRVHTAKAPFQQIVVDIICAWPPYSRPKGSKRETPPPPACVHIRDLRGQGLASCEGPNQPAGRYTSPTAAPAARKCASSSHRARPSARSRGSPAADPTWQQLQQLRKGWGSFQWLSSGRPLQVCRKVTAESWSAGKRRSF